MADPRDTELIQPYGGDIFTGHLATPVSASNLTRTFVSNLPAYRRGISPILRGLEIGMAHGYFVIGPWVLLGPLRNSPENANLGGLMAGIGLILIATAALSAYGLVSFPADNSAADYVKNDERTPEALKTIQGWSQLTAGFFMGATGGAFVAYFLLENFDSLDAMLRGAVNS
ncbi:MAG: photosystem I reaction center protein subunit XI [Cyanobacteria bacterium QS_8_64_29]|nr:MAG: photosystem I reaction center protein subunit XI [Cyanobacteria bacterium QS_8_64_29]